MARDKNDSSSDDSQGEQETFAFAGLNLPVAAGKSSEDIQRDIIARMSTATSWAELLTVHSGDSGKDKTGERHEFLEVGFDTFISPEGETLPIAHVKTINLDTGEPETWRTTATNIVAALALASKNSWLPVQAKIGGTKTKNGYDVQFLEPIK